MTLAEKDKLDEVLEYFHLKSSELKMTASETVEDEIKVLQDVIKFAQRKLDFFNVRLKIPFCKMLLSSLSENWKNPPVK